MKKILLGAAVAASLGTGAQAALVVDVSGITGVGFVSVDFSGSDIATSGFSGTSLGWGNLGNYLNSTVTTGFFGGNAEINIGLTSPVTTGITSLVFDDDGLGNVDDFGVFFASSVDFMSGDLVSWSSLEVILAQDISTLFNGSSTSTFFSTNDQGLDLQLTFSPKTAVVPLPATLPLALLGLGALGFVRRARRT